MTPEKKDTICPNCSSIASREGNVITCERCDAEFVIRQQARTVKTAGRIEQLERRVDQLEKGSGEPKTPNQDASDIQGNGELEEILPE